ncbi:MAG TPA: FMN-binding negative transcriptional regulator [Polyangiales bacterium]|nr:FMN-binding negative transcriptional regulator [Polyangiales bacterium]
MYVPESFRVPDRAVIAGFIAAHGFAVLVSQTEQGPFATHVPLLLERAETGDVLVGHMARANPHWRHFERGAEALVIFQGPHAYVSPSWYAASPAVPTWNYSVVHAYGRPAVVADTTRVRAIIDALAAQYESARATPWSTRDVPDEYVDRMIAAIVGFEIPIERLEGKFKLGQNRSPEDIAGALAGLQREGGPNGGALADFTSSELARRRP